MESVGSAQIDFATDAAGCCIVTIVGELDVSCADLVQEAVDTHLQDGPDRVVFELAGLEFMDSSGIAVLIQSKAKCGSLEVRNPTTIVRRVLEVTGLAHEFGIAT
jgi:anti-anti-sigma factor